jgi:N-acetylneuraminate synthase
MKTFIIAEAGVNHNGERDLAFQLVDAAVAAKVDAVKFQTFRAEAVVTKKAARAEYQKRNCDTEESQFEMLRRLELGVDLHHDLASYCEKKNIVFLSTAFDSRSLSFLVNDINLPILKISSGEITNGPFLLEHGRVGRPIILSTGMATLREVEKALEILAFGLMGEKSNPSDHAFAAAFQSGEGQELLREKITLLHCTTEYPAGEDEVNLLAIKTLSDSFGLSVGYSDHSRGIFIPPLAVAAGATVIEKHFTLDRNLPGPDHRASLDPSELREMVEKIRKTEKILGNGVKIPGEREKKNLAVVRRSLVAEKKIDKGEVFSAKNLAVRRPGTGVSPMEYWKIIGTQARKSYDEDEVIL